MDDDKIKTLCRLPENSMPVEVIEICAFIDPEGGNRWIFRVEGDSPLSTTIGLMEMAKHFLITRSSQMGDD